MKGLGKTIELVNGDALNIEVDECGFVTIIPSELNDDGFYEEDNNLAIVMSLIDLEHLKNVSFNMWGKLCKQI